MKVDLERLRAKAGWVGWARVPLERAELAALVAVVDAARAVRRVRVYGRPDERALYVALEPLMEALEPFAPAAPALPDSVYKRYGAKCDGITDDTAAMKAAHAAHGQDRAWEEVDRWNAERDLAVKAAVDETRRGATDEWRTMLAGRENYERLRQGNPRDRARDQLADAGVAVQRQFRSDQERIAELERERDLLLYSESGAELERDALRKELAETRRERDWAREETKLERAGRLPIGRGMGTKP